MIRLRYTQLTVTSVTTLALVSFGWFAGQATVQQSPDDKKSDDQVSHAMQLEYAEASLELAKVELEQAKNPIQTAQPVFDARPGSVFSSNRIRRLESKVEVAQQYLSALKNSNVNTTVTEQLAYAKGNVELISAHLAAAKEVHARDAQAVTEWDLKRLEARLKLARLRVSMWEDERHLPSLMGQMQWQIDRLSEEIIDVSQRIDDLAKPR